MYNCHFLEIKEYTRASKPNPMNVDSMGSLGARYRLLRIFQVTQLSEMRVLQKGNRKNWSYAIQSRLLSFSVLFSPFSSGWLTFCTRHTNGSISLFRTFGNEARFFFRSFRTDVHKLCGSGLVSQEHVVKSLVSGLRSSRLKIM